MIHYIQPQLLTEICSADLPACSLGTVLVEVIANVLDNEVSVLCAFASCTAKRGLRGRVAMMREVMCTLIKVDAVYFRNHYGGGHKI